MLHLSNVLRFHGDSGIESFESQASEAHKKSTVAKLSEKTQKKQMNEKIESGHALTINNDSHKQECTAHKPYELSKNKKQKGIEK